MKLRKGGGCMRCGRCELGDAWRRMREEKEQHARREEG